MPNINPDARFKDAGGSMTKLAFTASVVSFSFAALVSIVIIARPLDPTQLNMVPVAELKEIYLECDRLSSTTIVDFETAEICSMVYEELLRRGFENSYEQLLLWWRSARDNCTQFARCETP